jgi:hypothetical protein
VFPVSSNNARANVVLQRLVVVLPVVVETAQAGQHPALVVFVAVLRSQCKRTLGLVESTSEVAESPVDVGEAAPHFPFAAPVVVVQEPLQRRQEVGQGILHVAAAVGEHALAGLREGDSPLIPDPLGDLERLFD